MRHRCVTVASLLRHGVPGQGKGPRVRFRLAATVPSNNRHVNKNAEWKAPTVPAVNHRFGGLLKRVLPSLQAGTKNTELQHLGQGEEIAVL